MVSHFSKIPTHYKSKNIGFCPRHFIITSDLQLLIERDYGSPVKKVYST